VASIGPKPRTNFTAVGGAIKSVGERGRGKGSE